MWIAQQLAFYLTAMPFLSQILFPIFSATIFIMSVSHLVFERFTSEQVVPVVIVANEANL